MKKHLATATSVVGVLLAGAAAFAANSSVLSADSSAAPMVATEVTFPATGMPAVATPGNVQQTATPDSTTSSIATYKVGTAGTVMLDSANQQLRIINVIPASGWKARTAEAEKDGVKIQFASANQVLEFEADLEGTRVVVTVEDETVRPTPAPAAPRELHDDDDDHEEREHREDHHEDHEDEDDDD